ncbi:MAG: hypothetical protein IMW97_04360 [Firmicutes bacterium]|nr:hypothetical protein [Candidatus Fermentithermobacillaceae bacterium]
MGFLPKTASASWGLRDAYSVPGTADTFPLSTFTCRIRVGPSFSLSTRKIVPPIAAAHCAPCDDGVPCVSGARGVSGAPGVSGVAGVLDAPGVPGLSGVPGIPGVSGTPGDRGVSCVPASVPPMFPV